MKGNSSSAEAGACITQVGWSPMTMGIYFQITGVCMLAAKPMQLIDLWEGMKFTTVLGMWL